MSDCENKKNVRPVIKVSRSAHSARIRVTQRRSRFCQPFGSADCVKGGRKERPRKYRGNSDEKDRPIQSSSHDLLLEPGGGSGCIQWPRQTIGTEKQL